MVSESDTMIVIWSVLGVVGAAILFGLVYWLACYNRRPPSSSSAAVAVDDSSGIIDQQQAAGATMRFTRGGIRSSVPLQIVASPPEGCYSPPLVVTLRTVQPNLDILVRIVGVELNSSPGGARGSEHPLDGFGDSKEVAGLMLYRDPLEFVDPATYYILAHTLSPDKKTSEVHQFTYTVSLGGVGARGAGRNSGLLQPPRIHPASGEVSSRSLITLTHPGIAESSPVSAAARPLHGGTTTNGGGQAAVHALIAASDVTLWYSVDGTFPSLRYYQPFTLPLPRHQSQALVTVKAVSTSARLNAASEVSQASLTVVSDHYSHFDPTIHAPTIQLQASHGVLYFDDPQPEAARAAAQSNSSSRGGGGGGGGSSTAHHQQAGVPFAGIFQLPQAQHQQQPSPYPQQSHYPSLSSYELSQAQWLVMYSVEYVDSLRRAASSSTPPLQSATGVHVAPLSGEGVWVEYRGPVAVTHDVARLAAFTLCRLPNGSALRSAVVTYDVSRPWGRSDQDDEVASTSPTIGESQRDDPEHLRERRSKKGDKKAKSGRKSSTGEDRPSSVGPQSRWSGDGLRQHHHVAATAPFVIPPLPATTEDTTLATPVICITCMDVEVAFDEAPRGSTILYTLDGTDPSEDIDLIRDTGATSSSAAAAHTFEWRSGGGPLRLVRGEYDRVTLTARIFVPNSDGGGTDAAAAIQGYRYGHRFSRSFFFR